jgi:hypothetical protein
MSSSVAASGVWVLMEGQAKPLGKSSSKYILSNGRGGGCMGLESSFATDTLETAVFRSVT